MEAGEFTVRRREKELEEGGCDREGVEGSSELIGYGPGQESSDSPGSPSLLRKLNRGAFALKSFTKGANSFGR